MVKNMKYGEGLREDEKLVKIKQEEKRRLEEEFKKAQAATAARLKASGQNQGR